MFQGSSGISAFGVGAWTTKSSINPPRSDPFSFASTRHDVPWSEKSGVAATSRGSTQAEDEKVDGKEEEEQVEIKEVRV